MNNEKTETYKGSKSLVGLNKKDFDPTAWETILNRLGLECEDIDTIIIQDIGAIWGHDIYQN